MIDGFVRVSGAVVIVAILSTSTAYGIPLTFSDKAAFLASTGASSATGGPISGFAPFVTSYTQGQTTFTPGVGASSISIGCSTAGGLQYCLPEWSPSLVGDDIAITGTEDLNATFQAPVFSAGFEMIEPTSLNIGPGLSFIDSTFEISLLSGGVGGTVLDTFIFQPANDTVEFFGVWADFAFDTISIRETVGGIENEFFGEFYSGQVAYNPVPAPEPSILALLSVGLVGLGIMKRKQE